MKITTPILLALGAFASSAIMAQTPPEPKILVVDMSKLYENHWQTKAEMTKLKAEQQSASSQFDQMTKDINTMVTQYKELDEQAKDPMTTADAKAKATSDAQALLQQIQTKVTDRNNFGQTVQREFQQRVQNFHELMIDQISQKATEIAKAHGATLLLDKSGITMLATRAVIYSDPSYDITDEVAAAIDKDRPPTAPAGTVPAAPAPAPAPAPADSGPPPITVPGVTAPAQ